MTIRLFLVALALGYFLRPAPGYELRSRCESLLRQAGCAATVSISQHLVVVGVPPGGLSREAARALVSTQLPPADSLAVVTQPSRRVPVEALLLLPLLLLYRPKGRVRLTAPPWQQAARQAAVDAWRTRVASERGVLLPALPVHWGLRAHATVDGRPVDSARLETHLVDLIGPDELTRLLAAWRQTHLVTVRELLARFTPDDLLREVRRSLEAGDHLRDVDTWAQRVLAGQPC